jgi:hypothetical protein
MHTLRWLLSYLILVVPILLALVLPPKLYPILPKARPATLLRIGAPIRANNPNMVCSCACSFNLANQLMEMRKLMPPFQTVSAYSSKDFYTSDRREAQHQCHGAPIHDYTVRTESRKL